MPEKIPPRTAILPSDIDAQGNVVLWDHGPAEPRPVPGDTEEQVKARRERHDALVKAWKDEHGDMAAPTVMSSGDAGHAMTVEPGRYALEPDGIDEGEIEKRIKAIRDKREAAREFAQTVIDRKTVIAEIMSERTAKLAADKLAAEPAPEPGMTVRTTEPRPLEPAPTPFFSPAPPVAEPFTPIVEKPVV